MTTTCFVSYEMHPTNRGGCGVLLHHATDLLLSQGHRVVLLLDIPPDFVRRFNEQDRLKLARPENCIAYCVEELSADFAWSPADVPNAYQWRATRFAHSLAKVRQREAIDYVEFFEYCGVGYYAFAQRLFAKDPGTGVLGTRLHGSIENFDRLGCVRTADSLVLHGLERRALDLSEVVITPSRTYYEVYCRPMYHVEPARVVVSSPPKQDAGRVPRRITPDGPFTIAFVGRMFHFKGVDQLVRASVMLMEQRPHLSFNVEMMGYDSDDGPVPGSYTAYLKTLVPAPLQHRFIFTDFITHEQIAERLSQALFCIFPNRVESFCYALHEAYDLGVPCIANDLPAFRDFFEDGRNALIYDGSTPALLAAMKRMIDEPELRERLSKPYEVGGKPLGDYYSAPAAPVPLAPATPAANLRTTAVILCDNATFTGCRALRTLARQTLPADRAICLVPADAGGRDLLWWLGRPWHVRTPEGAPIPATDLFTTDALAVVRAGDALDDTWMESCQRALSRRPAMAFAGTWPRQEGRVVPLTIDVAPELHPFDGRAELIRVLARTRPGVLFSDLLDPGLQSLGHLGYLWWATAHWGNGVLLHTPLIETVPAPAALHAEPNAVRALVMRFGEPLAERLRLVAALLAQPANAPAQPTAPLPQAPPTVEQKIALADELGGKTLARLALKKLTRRVTTGRPANTNGTR